MKEQEIHYPIHVYFIEETDGAGYYYPFKYYDGVRLPPDEVPDVPWEKLAAFNQDKFRSKARELMSALMDEDSAS